MKKQIFTLLTLLVLCVTGAWAAAVGDLKTISTDYVFIADNITANGTVKLTANTLYEGGLIFAPTANSVSTGKGNISFDGGSHLNSLRLKNSQDRLAFKVAGPCSITFYTQSHSSRGIKVGKVDYSSSEPSGDNLWGSQTASTTSWTCNITSAGTVYLWSYGGDFYFAGFKVEFPKTGQPTISANPVSATYTVGDAATALSVTATAASTGELSYQWYKNETCQSALEAEGAAAISGATNATYTPSTASAGTTYYFCKVTEEGNANVATSRMAKVQVDPAGFNVTFSLGEVTGTEGKLPENQTAVLNLTIPTNTTLFKADNTLTAWNDGSANHAIGSNFALTADVTLTPVFTANTKHLGQNASTATWNFNHDTGAPTLNMDGSGTYVYVTQTSIGGVSTDLKMLLDATGSGAKFASNGAWTQINTNAKMTISVVTGTVVKIYTYSAAGNPTFNGETGVWDSTKKIYSYTTTSDGDLDIVYTGDDYASKIEVTYPSETALLTVSEDNTIVPLTKANILDKDYLAVSTDNWATGKSYGGYSGDFYNMSSEGRNVTIKVKGVKTFEAFVRNDGDAARDFYVKVGDATAVKISAPASTLKSTGIFAVADPSAETTLMLSGGGSSVYPVYFIFNESTVVTTNAGKWTSFTPSWNATLASGAKAYIITDVDETTVTATAVTTLKAGEGYFVKGEAASTGYTATATDVNADDVTDNLIVGQLSATTINATTPDSNTKFVLGTKAGVSGLYKVNSDVNIAAGKAYLNAQKVVSANSLSFDFDGETTGIQQVEAQKELLEGDFYNLAGQRVAQPTKGLFIVNGKKVIIK